MSLQVEVPGVPLGDEKVWERLLSPGGTTPGTLIPPGLCGKRILITGAGGSIGAALTRALLPAVPESLVLLDTSEDALYRINRSLDEAGCRVHRPVLGSVGEGDRLARLFAAERPQIVFHAAALKHVPLMELNPFAAIETNALGTFRLATVAAAYGAEELVLVSTDKAVEPQSIMGASKRLAELVLLAVGATGPTQMKAVRLGNVLGSQGSVLPLFLEQIARGGPVTVTHPEAERYFLRMELAVEAIFAAAEVDASPAILAPDLGRPLRVLDLADYLLRRAESCAKIEFRGLRAGDKLRESLLSRREQWVGKPQQGLRQIASEAASLESVTRVIEALEEASRSGDLGALLHTVTLLVPEYRPSEAIRAAIAAEGEVPAFPSGATDQKSKGKGEKQVLRQSRRRMTKGGVKVT